MFWNDKLVDLIAEKTFTVSRKLERLFNSARRKFNNSLVFKCTLLKFNNRSIRLKCEICLKLTIKTRERRHWHRSGVLIVNFEHISHCSSVSIVNFEYVIACWNICFKILCISFLLVQGNALCPSTWSNVTRSIWKDQNVFI